MNKLAYIMLAASACTFPSSGKQPADQHNQFHTLSSSEQGGHAYTVTVSLSSIIIIYMYISYRRQHVRILLNSTQQL